MQDLGDTGCYMAMSSSGGATMDGWQEPRTYTLDDEISMMSNLGISVSIYPDEASAASETGCISIGFRYPAGNEPSPLKDCPVTILNCTTEEASVWGDNLRFDFPITMTLDQLTENSGDPGIVEDGEYSYSVNLIQFWRFQFDENGQLSYITMSGL